MNTSELKEMRMQCFPGRVVEYVQTINFLGDVSWSVFFLLEVLLITYYQV